MGSPGDDADLTQWPPSHAERPHDVGEALTEYFRDEGIDVVTHATPLGAHRRRGTGKSCVTSPACQELQAAGDEIFYALGRVPNVAGLDLERAAGVAYGAVGGIDVDATNDVYEQSERATPWAT